MRNSWHGFKLFAYKKKHSRPRASGEQANFVNHCFSRDWHVEEIWRAIVLRNVYITWEYRCLIWKQQRAKCMMRLRTDVSCFCLASHFFSWHFIPAPFSLGVSTHAFYSHWILDLDWLGRRSKETKTGFVFADQDRHALINPSIKHRNNYQKDWILIKIARNVSGW